MKKSISLYLLLCACFSLSAFNYQTVYSHRTALFANSTNVIRSLRIDSTKFIGDSILYPLKNIQELDANCFTPYGASWLGTKIIVKEKWNYFFNESNDTIKIKTNASLNEQWTVYQQGDVTVWATVKKVEQLSFLGLTDSVKTITFVGAMLTSTITQGEKLKSITFDGTTMLLSKHYGLINTPSFLFFPYQDKNTKYFTGSWEDNSLVGLTNPKVGLQNLTWFDVHDFQVGDEIHQKYNYFETTTGPPTLVNRSIIQKYLSREDFKDSIVYKVETTIDFRSYYDNALALKQFSSVVTKSVINRDSLFDLLPNEPYIMNGELCQNHIVKDSFDVKSVLGFIPFNKRLSCWTYQLDYVSDVCNYGQSVYYKELGGPYYKLESGCWEMQTITEENKLVYYKKGSATWGTPLVLTGLNQPEAKPETLIYPNPTKESISISSHLLTESCTFELMDLRGIIVLCTEVDTNNNSINFGSFSTGMYMYRITSNGKLLKSGKIVKM